MGNYDAYNLSLRDSTGFTVQAPLPSVTMMAAKVLSKNTIK